MAIVIVVNSVEIRVELTDLVDMINADPMVLAYLGIDKVVLKAE